MASIKKAYIPVVASHKDQATALGLCVAVNASTVIWGPPGHGKSKTIEAIATANNLHLEPIIASTKEPPDFAGFPFIDKGLMKLAPPLWVNNIVREYAENKRLSIAFFDELSTAVPATQAAVLTTILDRRSGETQMPMQTRMLAAANPPKIAANGWDLTPPMANRFTHLDWQLDAETVARGFQVGWDAPVVPRLPRNMAALIKNGRVLVGSFIKTRPAMVDFDFSKWSGNPSGSDDFRASNNAWPSPRSWEVAAKLFAAATAARDAEGKPLNSEIKRLLLEGTVGVAASTEFLEYVAKLDLPNPIDLLNDPGSFIVPDRGDKISAVLASVHHEATNHYKQPVYPQVWSAWGDIIALVVDKGKGDVAFEFARDWMKYRPEGTAMSSRHTSSLGPLLKQFEGI